MRGTVLSRTIVIVSSLSGLLHAVETTVQNDSLVDGSSGTIEAGFIPGESAAVWLTSPCNGDIVAVQVFWTSETGGTAPSIEDSITIFEAGAFPVPGDELELLIAPVLTDGVMNEFRFLDENNTMPIQVPIAAGEVFVVALQFANTPDPDNGPSVMVDGQSTSPSCQLGKNAIDCIPPGLCSGWTDACDLILGIGVPGDFVMRAVVDCSDDAAGACCLADGSCDENQTSTNCAIAGGAYQGNFTNCGTTTCPETGACCVNGTCNEPVIQVACENASGTYQGDASECASVMCPQPPQACCVPVTESCLDDTTPVDCGFANGILQGEGVTCAEVTCFPRGACCNPDGTCGEDVLDTDCAGSGGTFQGDGSLCSGVTCPQPTGACCSDVSCSTAFDEAFCLALGNTWGGAFTTCDDADMNGTPDACEGGGGDDCSVAGDCCDLDANNIRDNNCEWCACNATVCEITPLPVYADMGGAFGACPPDFFANIHDRNLALTCFEGTTPCETLNIDAGGSFGTCPADGFCNIHDANHALNAFGGTNTCACGPAPEVDGGGSVVGRADLVLRSSKRRIISGERVVMRVFVDGSTADLQSYQVAARASGGLAGQLQLVGVHIESRKDSLFSSASGAFSAFNVDSGRMLSGIATDVSVKASAYLATFEFQASKNAAGAFVIDVDPAHTFLIQGAINEVAIDNSDAVIVHVSPRR
jgi:hypothetical protein